MSNLSNLSNHEYVEQLIIEMSSDDLLEEFRRCDVLSNNWNGDPLHTPMYLFWKRSVENHRQLQDDGQNTPNNVIWVNDSPIMEYLDENGCVHMNSDTDSEIIMITEEDPFAT